LKTYLTFLKGPKRKRPMIGQLKWRKTCHTLRDNGRWWNYAFFFNFKNTKQYYKKAC